MKLHIRESWRAYATDSKIQRDKLLADLRSASFVCRSRSGWQAIPNSAR